MLHNTENGVVGGAVNREWMRYSLEQYDGYDPAVVIPESVKDDSNSTVDLPFNNTAINSPVVYAPQLVGFAAGRVLSTGLMDLRMTASLNWLVLRQAVY